MPGKFEGTQDPKVAQYLWELSLMGVLDDEIGRTDEASHWYGLLLIDREELPHFDEIETPELGDSYIISCDNYGFVTYEEFPNEMAARQTWKEIRLETSK